LSIDAAETTTTKVAISLNRSEPFVVGSVVIRSRCMSTRFIVPERTVPIAKNMVFACVAHRWGVVFSAWRHRLSTFRLLTKSKRRSTIRYDTQSCRRKIWPSQAAIQSGTDHDEASQHVSGTNFAKFLGDES